MKLEIYNYFPDTTPHAKFQGPTSTWVVWANSQFVINYKHETNALAYTFKAGSWQI